jgi:tetratricopeptide (TPR) repeat protein
VAARSTANFVTPRLVRGALLCMALALCAPLPATADQRDPRLGGLFAELRNAPSAADAERTASEIWNLWNSAGDEEIDRLMQVGSRALARGSPSSLGVALETFSEIVERAPGFAEGWNKRATVYFQLGDYEASMRDVKVVLELEPRHFAALSGMGLMYSDLEADAPALRWFERALSVHPHLPGIRERVAMLHKRLDDSGI